jgi:arylsulfatase A-like enzyme
MTTFEGGPRVPFFAQWKGTFPAGVIYDKPVMNLDVLPTVVTAAGGKLGGNDKLDGLDLVPYVTGKDTTAPHDKLFWRFGEQWAVRSGDWKLVVSRGGSGKPELYNLADDIGEAKDLATAEPAKVAELEKLYAAWNAEQAPASAVDQPRPAGGKKKNAAKPGARVRKKKAAAGNAE